jgi:putative restriction endonuclease
MKKWDRHDLIIAFNLYCQMPFGKIHSRNPLIIQVADGLGRTPSSLAMKMCNFASLDPVIISSGRHGLGNASNADRAIWEEFHSNWDKLAFESEQLLEKIVEKKSRSSKKVISDEVVEGKERESLARVRINQNFFRATVLASYDSRCCITGLAIPDLLNASHIVPWSVDVANRVNPRNGLCLNVIHDRAFDRGLITVTPDYRVKLSPSVKFRPDDHAATAFLKQFDNTQITLPQRFQPDMDFLKYHNEKVFRAK